MDVERILCTFILLLSGRHLLYSPLVLRRAFEKVDLWSWNTFSSVRHCSQSTCLQLLNRYLVLGPEVFLKVYLRLRNVSIYKFILVLSGLAFRQSSSS